MTDTIVTHIAHIAPKNDGGPFEEGHFTYIGQGHQTILGCAKHTLTDEEVIRHYGYAVPLSPFGGVMFRVDGRETGEGLRTRCVEVVWNDPRLEAVLAEVGHSRWALYQRTLKPEWVNSLETLSTMADNAEREDLMIHPERDGITLSYLTFAKKYLDRVQRAHEKNPGSVYLRNLYDEAIAEVCHLIVVSPKGHVLGSIYKAPVVATVNETEQNLNK